MSEKQIISTTLGSTALERFWETYNDTAPDSGAPDSTHFADLQDTMRHVLSDINSASDQQEAITLVYIQLRTKWILLNTQIADAILLGKSNAATFQYASLLSGLLGELEQHIASDRLAILQQQIFEGTGMPSLPTVTKNEEIGWGRQAESLAKPRDVVVESVTEDVVEARLRQLHQTVTILQREVNRLYAERDTLTEELGRSDIHDIIALVRSLEARLRRQSEAPAQQAPAPPAKSSHIIPSENSSAPDMLGYLKQETGYTDIRTAVTSFQQIRREQQEAQTEIAALRQQLLHGEKQLALLRQEFGGAEPAQIVQYSQGLVQELAELRERTTEMFQEREQIAELLGVVTTSSLLEQVRLLSGQHDRMRQRVENYAEVSEILLREIGSADINHALRIFRGLNETIQHLTQQLVRYENERAEQLQDAANKMSFAYPQTVPMAAIDESDGEIGEDMEAMFASLDKALKTLMT